MTRLVLVSDTHTHEPELPDGDVLVHAGDLCARGTMEELGNAAAWLGRQPHKHKIVIAGNHDWPLFRLEERSVAEAALRRAGVTYLRDESARVEGLHFYGSPWTPEFGGWAFMVHSEPALACRYDAIPETVDVLVTHGPPRGILDLTADGVNAGSLALWRRLGRLGAALHVFGHIHEGYGQWSSARLGGTEYVNASTCTRDYKPTNPPIVVDL